MYVWLIELRLFERRLIIENRSWMICDLARAFAFAFCGARNEQ
jgi:hypothetical protein